MIIGNQKLISLIDNMIISRRLPQFMIIEGADGMGKRTLARRTAAAALCKSIDTAEIPCGVCTACIKSEKLIHPDVFEMYGTEASGNFPVEAIRELRQEAFVMPSESDYKFIIFLGADTMSPKSQNALLKILEEPPSYAVFIITCRSALSLLSTVRSRAVNFTMSPVDFADAGELLTARFPEAAQDELARILKEKRGNLGETILALNNEDDDKAAVFAETFAELLLESNELPLLLHSAALEKNRALAKAAIPRISEFFRDALVYKNGGAVPGETVKRLVSSFSSAQLIALIEAVREAEIMLERNIYGALFATVFPASLRQAAGK